MNKYGLLINKSIVEYCVNNDKWKIYLKYLNTVKQIKYLYHKSKGNVLLSEGEYIYILNTIDEELKKTNIPNRCLIRSSIAMIYLSSFNNKFAMNIGVGINPFRAHSWISLNGMPVCEPEDVSKYITLACF